MLKVCVRMEFPLNLWCNESEAYSENPTPPVVEDDVQCETHKC
jgi:hypothetical protein